MKPIGGGVLTRFDFVLLIPALVLGTIGVLFIYSSGINSSGINTSGQYLIQIRWIILGLALFVGMSFVRYSFFKEYAWIFYVVFCILVLVAAFTGRTVKGARSWLGIGELGIQPSEFLKIATILLLGRILERSAPRIQELKVFLLCAAIPMAAIIFIFMQPDLGTASVFIPIFLAMAYMAGARKRHLAYAILIISLTAFFVFLPAWDEFIYPEAIPVLMIFTNKDLILVIAIALGAVVLLAFLGMVFLKYPYLYWLTYGSSLLAFSYIFSIAGRMVLKPYQIMRLVVFLDPYVDPRGSGWNIIQSLTAVGSGGFDGKGFLQGTQSHLQFLPEQSTDFIFSIISEEMGFVGALLIFGAFMVILVRCLFLIRRSKDLFSACVVAGIAGMFFFHVVVNIGMTIGIMPITGIPLLLLSYGGSSMLSTMLALGILSSINAHRFYY